MNIFEFCEKFNISLAKARRMVKAKVLRLDESVSDVVLVSRHALSQGQDLTAAQMVYFVEHPRDIIDLGRYEIKARAQMESLQDVIAAPKDVAIYVTNAASGDPESVTIIIDWLKNILPVDPVSHSYIAVRLLLGISENIRHYDAPRIPRVMYNCRKHPSFADWWHTEKIKNRNRTLYHKPFDL